ncbi:MULTISPECIES: prepilin peptidase [unclassified Microbacterium]|uniref:prepilin peptidase n=1 Tax=unclassified Microbacterium TaxID=2609290 RepID=UPI0037475BF5
MWLAVAAEIAALTALAVWSVALTIIDVRTHRLPDRLVLPAYPIAAALLGSAAVLRGEPERLLTIGGGALALFAFYLALRLARAGGMGGGDVKLAGVLGLFLGAFGWETVLFGALAGFVFGGVYATVLLLTRRASRTHAVAFGPWMLLGAWAAVIPAIVARAG